MEWVMCDAANNLSIPKIYFNTVCFFFLSVDIGWICPKLLVMLKAAKSATQLIETELSE